MSIPKINEASAATVEFDCYDKDDAAEVPSTMSYRIDDVISGAVIRESTSVTPASSGTIALLPADTTLQDQENETELRILTITLDAGLDSQFHRTFLFDVLNLRAIT